MLKVDKAILTTNRNICENISMINFSDRGFISQNILAQLRNFVEYIAVKVSFKDQDVEPNDRDLHEKAIGKMRGYGNLRFLSDFHAMIQQSGSHYTCNKDGSERLMLKYYEYLLKIKQYLKQTYNMEVLENINDFPLEMDTELLDYYQKIGERIETPSLDRITYSNSERYYIQKVKPFFINQRIYYEVTFNIANGDASKFNRIIAFTKQEIVDNYAVKFSMHSDKIRIFGKDMPILVIDGYEVSIRPCEWNNLAKICGIDIKCNTGASEYRELMKYLTETRVSLTELVSSDQGYYNSIRNKVISNTKIPIIFKILDCCRKIIVKNKPGPNLLRYLLYKMNNRIIKQQYCSNQCNLLSNLYVQYGCNPFETMPYCTSLKGHNPKTTDLFRSIPFEGREHEFLARNLKNNTEVEGVLFTPKKAIEDVENVDSLIKKYNSQLYSGHQGRKINEFKGHLYIEEYVMQSTSVIEHLQELSSSGIPQYTTRTFPMS